MTYEGSSTENSPETDPTKESVEVEVNTLSGLNESFAERVLLGLTADDVEKFQKEILNRYDIPIRELDSLTEEVARRLAGLVQAYPEIIDPLEKENLANSIREALGLDPKYIERG
jgi:hypothetical protein